MLKILAVAAAISAATGTFVGVAYDQTANGLSRLDGRLWRVQKRDFNNQYYRAGLPSPMLRYYDPHPTGPGPHPFSSYCCNWNDCGFAKPGSVTWTPDGYRVRMPDGLFQIVPEDSPAIRPVYEKGHEKEPRFAACILPKGMAIESYLENISPGSVASPSTYYVRCLYIGRSGQ